MNDIDTTPVGAPEILPTDGGDAAQGILSTVRDVTTEIVRVVRTTAIQATEGWSLPAIARAVVPELGEAYRERDTLRAEVETLHAERLALETRLDESGRARAALEASLTETRQRLERREADAHDAASREHQVREQLEATMARTQSDREETLRLAREMVDSAETTRSVMASELETAREALASERSSLAALLESRSQAQEGVADTEAELSRARATIAELEEHRMTTNAELERLHATLARTESELLAAQHEHQVSQVKLQTMCGTHDEIVQERDRLSRQVGELHTRIRELEERPTPAGTTVGAGLLERARDHERSLEAELAAAAATASAATARVTLLQSELAVAVDTATRHEYALRSATEEHGRLAAAFATATARIRALERESEDTRAVETTGTAEPPFLATLGPEVADAPVESLATDDVESPPIEPLATLETFAAPEVTLEAAGPALDEPAPESVSCRLAMLDEAGWKAPEGVTLETLPLETEAGESARELDAEVCLVNLAQPKALAAAVRLRVEGATTPLWGYAIASDARLGIGLGAIDVIPRPIEPEHVHQQLAGRVRPGATVVVVRSDGATLLALRQGLLPSGHSVRTAWTLAQAAELAGSLSAAVVVIDLAQEPARAAELCVDLARRDAPPLLILLPGTPAQVEEFATALRTLAGTTGEADHDALIARARTMATAKG